VVQNQEGEAMTCPFCKAAPRSDWGYECGTGPDANKQRSVRCRDAEIATLRERINLLAHELESVGVQCGIAVVNEGIATNENTRLRERINQLEEERDAMMADLLLWRETVEAKP
jgi:hypothetical protein